MDCFKLILVPFKGSALFVSGSDDLKINKIIRNLCLRIKSKCTTKKIRWKLNMNILYWCNGTCKNTFFIFKICNYTIQSKLWIKCCCFWISINVNSIFSFKILSDIFIKFSFLHIVFKQVKNHFIYIIWKIIYFQSFIYFVKISNSIYINIFISYLRQIWLENQFQIFT